MKRIVTILVMAWAAMNFVGTVMPLPDELQIFANLPNSLRWLALLVVVVGAVALKYPRYFTWGGLKNLLSIGISWERGNWYFLGMVGSADPSDTRITGFQLRGFNNSRKTMECVRAALTLPSGEEIPLRVTTTDPNMDLAVSVDVPPATRIYVNGSLGRLEPTEFIKKYTPLQFDLKWKTGKSRIMFSRRMTEKLISRFEASSKPRPISYLSP